MGQPGLHHTPTPTHSWSLQGHRWSFYSLMFVSMLPSQNSGPFFSHWEKNKMKNCYCLIFPHHTKTANIEHWTVYIYKYDHFTVYYYHWFNLLIYKRLKPMWIVGRRGDLWITVCSVSIVRRIQPLFPKVLYSLVCQAAFNAQPMRWKLSVSWSVISMVKVWLSLVVY